MSQSQGIEGGTTDKAFQTLPEQCFLWERGADVAQDKTEFDTSELV